MKRDELARRTDVSPEFIADAEAMGLLQPDLESPYQAGLIAWVIKLRDLRKQGLSWDEIYVWTRPGEASHADSVDETQGSIERAFRAYSQS